MEKTSSSGMQLTRLKIKNFLSISDVEIFPKKVTQIVGGNNQGKTTILKALETALAGSPDKSLVKRGESAAEIIVEFDDVVVHRKIRADGKQEVSVKKGDFKTSSPQSLLNTFFDANAFNPLELLTPKAREEAILKSIPLSVSQDEIMSELEALKVGDYIPPVDFKQHGLKVLDQVGKYFYQRRTEANKFAAEAAAKFKIKQGELPPAPLVPEDARTDEEIVLAIGEIQREKAVQYARVQEVAKKREVLNEVQSARAHKIQEIGKLSQAIERLKMEEEELGLRAENLNNQISESQFNIEEAEKLNAQEKALEEIRHARMMRVSHDKLVDQVSSFEEDANLKKAFADSLDAAVKYLARGLPEKLIARVEMPVPGLEYVEGEFLLDGVKIENLSTSASMRLAVALARKLGAKTKIICLDGAEALDEDSYRQLHELIANDDYTYFITKVGEPFEAVGDQIVRMENGTATIQ